MPNCRTCEYAEDGNVPSYSFICSTCMLTEHNSDEHEEEYVEEE